MTNTGKSGIFNSIGVIGLLVMAGVLLTTLVSPVNAWRDTGIPDYVQMSAESGLVQQANAGIDRAVLTLPR